MNENSQCGVMPSTEPDIRLLVSQLWSGRRTICMAAVISGAFAAAFAFWLPPTYTARSSLMPPQQQSSGLAAALGSLGALAGVGGGGALKNPNDLYVGILRSQNVEDSLIRRFDLRSRYEAKSNVDARLMLEKQALVQSAKSGLIEISVEDKDPVFAAKLANAYIDELKRVNQSLAVTDAAKRRTFFEHQLKNVRAALSEAETQLELLQKSTGLILPEGQVSGVIKAVADLQARIAAKEVQLVTMRSFATDSNPDLVRTQQELNALRQQLADYSSAEKDKASLLPSAAKLPEKGAAYVRALREVKYQEALLEVMSKQYELARVDEARDSSLIQVLDYATAPDKKSGPKRMVIVLAGLIFGSFAGAVLVFVRKRQLVS